MSEAIDAIFDAWSLPPWLTLGVVAAACVYLRGWMAIRRTRASQFTFWRLGLFAAGLVALWIAVASPLDGFADVLLSAHMVQHLILMSVAPPLLLLGWPGVPLLRGLPAWVRGPILRPTALRHLGRWIISPVVAWIAMNATFLGWHVPAAYDFALTHEDWHVFEHVCFLSSSLAFWWCVVQPWPSPRQRNRWGLLLYLLSADVVNTALSGFLAFCDWPVYRYYLTHANPFQVLPLSDQVIGAVIMWVGGSLVFIVPAGWIVFTLLQFPAHQLDERTIDTGSVKV